jgi:hypothetical protein
MRNWSWKYGSSSLSWVLLLLLGLLLIASSSSSAQVPFGAQVPAYGKPSLGKPTSFAAALPCHQILLLLPLLFGKQTPSLLQEPSASW